MEWREVTSDDDVPDCVEGFLYDSNGEEYPVIDVCGDDDWEDDDDLDSLALEDLSDEDIFPPPTPSEMSSTPN